MPDDTNRGDVRTVSAPDGTDIPVPSGGLGLGDGSTLDVRPDAQVQVSPKSDNGWYVVVDTADASNNEAADLFKELTVEGAIHTLEKMATDALAGAAEVAIKIGGAVVGVLVSLFTSSNLTREIFIRGTLEDGTPITYCILA